MAPLAYFITFRTYGSWLHGDERGTMDPANAVYGEERLPRDDFRRRAMAASLKNETPMLTADRRTVVEAAIRKVCETKEWELHALNVRTNHVHVVVCLRWISPNRCCGHSNRGPRDAFASPG